MSSYFFDTSALVKRYINETGSTWVQSVIAQPVQRIHISRITETEVSAALTCRLDLVIAALQLADFDQDIEQIYTLASVTDFVVTDAVQLARTRRLRGCDSIQLATAIRVAKRNPSIIFVCSDNDLLIAAAAEGLQTDNPELHP